MTTSYSCSSDKGGEYTSSNGASTCDKCVSSYYMNAGECVKKENGVDSSVGDTTLSTMWITQGFYRLSSTSTHVYECPYPANCVGQRYDDSYMNRSSLYMNRSSLVGDEVSVCVWQ